jgi:hypothetical protein
MSATMGSESGPRVARGVAYVLCAYEAGQLIDLDAAERRITSLTERASIRHKRRAPRAFEYRPAPLRVLRPSEPLPVGAYRTEPQVDAVLFDFGAISITYAIRLGGPVADLVDLSAELYENAALLADSRRHASDLLTILGPAVSRPALAEMVETYAVFQIHELAGGQLPTALLGDGAPLLAQILRAEREPLSAQEVRDALACQLMFGTADLTLIDADTAMVFDADAEDTIAVLEFANVDLLEMRFLDQQLDDGLDQAYRALSRRGWGGSIRPGAARDDLHRIGQLQVDAALMFEAVNNALKLVGDQFLARVYRLASDRFHLADWDVSILRKLETLESIYSKVGDLAATRRMEVLEWIIILLIAFEIVLSLFR